MIMEQSIPETKMLFMLLANIAQSVLANQNHRILRGAPNYNNFCQQQYGCDHREENHAVSLSFMPCSALITTISVNKNMAASIARKIMRFR